MSGRTGQGPWARGLAAWKGTHHGLHGPPVLLSPLGRTPHSGPGKSRDFRQTLGRVLILETGGGGAWEGPRPPPPADWPTPGSDASPAQGSMCAAQGQPAPALVGVGGGKTGKVRRVFPKASLSPRETQRQRGRDRDRGGETPRWRERRRDTEREGTGRDRLPSGGEVRSEGEWSPGGYHHSAVRLHSPLPLFPVSVCETDVRLRGRCSSGCRLTRGSRRLFPLSPRRLGLKPEVCGLGFQGGQHRCSWARGPPHPPLWPGRQGRVVSALLWPSPSLRGAPPSRAGAEPVLSLTRLLPGVGVGGGAGGGP